MYAVLKKYYLTDMHYTFIYPIIISHTLCMQSETYDSMQATSSMPMHVLKLG